MDSKKLLQNQLIRRILLRTFRLFSVLNQIVPKRRDRILLYDSFNTELEDNTRALLLHLIQNGYQERYRIEIGMPRNPHYDEFAQWGIHTHGSVGSILLFMTSKFFFTSFGNTRIRPAKGQRVVNLWHGTPLKTIGRLGGDHPEEDLDYFTVTLAASQFFKPIMAAAFGCDERKVLICGHARTDAFFSDRDLDQVDFRKLGLPDGCMKKVLWMPTFRSSSDGIYQEGRQIQEQETGLPVIRTQEEYRRLNAWLHEKGILLVIKVHNYSESLRIRSLSNIRIVSGEKLRKKQIELYSLIRSFDAMVTDYSSVLFDYMLLDRPLGFAVDDLEQYQSSRGFVVEDPREFMAGAQFEDLEGMLSFFQTVLDDSDPWQEQRQKIRILANRYCDGNNCRRLLRKVGIQ